MSSTITRVTVQSGKPSLGSMISAASINIKAVAAYMASTLGTPRLLSSFQNPGLLFDIYAKDGFSAIYNLRAKKSNRCYFSTGNISYLRMMADALYTKIKKKNLLRRIRIFRVLVYIAAAIAAGAFTYCIIDWHGWSWILIGATYVLLAVNFGMQVRTIKKELARREDLRAAKAEARP
jgi:hypothetical protein